MTIGIRRLLEAIQKIGRRYVSVLARGLGENDKEKRQRLRNLLERVLASLPSAQKKVNEVVVDATNRLRFAFARAVLKGLLECKGELSIDHTEEFVVAAVRGLVAELWDYCIVAEALGAEYLLIVLDAWKEDVVLLHKGRHAKDEKLIEEHDVAKLTSFMGDCGTTIGRKGQQSAMKTDAEAFRQVSAVVADLLHRTQSGHAMVRLILDRAVNKLCSKFPSLRFEVGECYEADFACLNGPWTFRDGVMVPRAANCGVVVMTLDGDLATQIPYGVGCQDRVFLQVLVTGSDVLIRRPQDLQTAVLREMVQTFAETVPARTLFLENLDPQTLSVAQRLNLFLMLGPAMGDYTLRVKESRFLKDAKGFLPTEPYFQVMRAFVAICMDKGNDADVSWPHIIWVAKTTTISYFEASHKKSKQRNRLIAALEDVENQREVFYGGLSRLVSMFPLKEDRQCVLPVFYTMWPRKRMHGLYQVVEEKWLDEAAQVDFRIRPIHLEAHLAYSFITEFFRPAFKPKSATLLAMQWLRNVPLAKDFFVYLYKLLGGVPGTWFSQHDWDVFYQRRPSTTELHRLNWRRVDVRGAVGPGTANQSSTGSTKKKKKRNPKRDPTVERFPGYFLSDGTLIDIDAASKKLGELYSRIVLDASFRDSLLGCSSVAGRC